MTIVTTVHQYIPDGIRDCNMVQQVLLPVTFTQVSFRPVELEDQEEPGQDEQEPAYDLHEHDGQGNSIKASDLALAHLVINSACSGVNFRSG